MILLDWGRSIKVKFDTDNLHLSDRHTHDTSEKVIAVVQQLGSTVGRLQAQMSEMSLRLARFEDAHTSSMGRIERSLGALTLGGSTHSSAASPAAPAAPAAPLAAAAPATPATPAARPPVPLAVGSQRGLDRRDVSAGSAPAEEYKFGGKHAGVFYLDCMANFENLPVNLTNDKRASDGKRVGSE